MKLKLANKANRDRYWGVAMDWADQQDWAYYCNDRFAAIKGIAEFQANQMGETIFESYQGREYEEV